MFNLRPCVLTMVILEHIKALSIFKYTGILYIRYTVLQFIVAVMYLTSKRLAVAYIRTRFVLYCE